MIYVFDTSAFVILEHYFPNRFPSFWNHVDSAVEAGDIISVREVLKELSARKDRKEHLDQWIESHKSLFLTPTPEETAFVRQIFVVPHFQQMVDAKHRLRGAPVADPFVIALARVRSGCVVTQESLKPHAAKIPNVCQHFGIRCCNLESFMEQMGWQF